MSTARARIVTVATPCGPFTVMTVADAVIASGWTDDPFLLVAPLGPAVCPDGWTTGRDLGPSTQAVEAYFDGALSAIEDVVVDQRCGPFIEQAWAALRSISPGSPITYRTLAERCGRPRAARGAGSACQRNAAALFVPCHRVVRGDGSLGGFRWGLPVKRWLLEFEAQHHDVEGASDGQGRGDAVGGVEAVGLAVGHGKGS